MIIRHDDVAHPHHNEMLTMLERQPRPALHERLTLERKNGSPEVGRPPLHKYTFRAIGGTECWAFYDTHQFTVRDIPIAWSITQVHADTGDVIAMPNFSDRNLQIREGSSSTRLREVAGFVPQIIGTLGPLAQLLPDAPPELTARLRNIGMLNTSYMKTADAASLRAELQAYLATL